MNDKNMPGIIVTLQLFKSHCLPLMTCVTEMGILPNR